MRTWSRALLICALTSCVAACITQEQQYADYGVAANQVGFVPARIAILPCQLWPTGSRFRELPLSSAKPDELQGQCAALNQKVVEAFNAQPFMQGYSPKFVQQNLANAGKGDLVAALPQVWAQGGGTCLDCPSVPAYYAKEIASKPQWQLWLQTLSQNVRNADAVLFPFVTYAYTRNVEDRGLQIAERATGVALLLVSTATGELIWAGGREAVVPVKHLEQPGTPPPEPPAWSTVNERLYTEALWSGFPGRQVFD